jgi:hypothetical protein
MKYLYWAVVVTLSIASYFFPQFIIPISILLASGYMRWINVLVVSVAKTADEDTKKVIKSVNDCVGMINQQTSVIKRLHVTGSDLDELEREVRKQKKEMNHVKNEIKRK